MTLTIAYLCVLVAALLPYLWIAIAKASAPRYDNHDPRSWIAQQDNPRLRRAYHAHSNALEAFAPFAAAVLMAQLAGVATSTITALSLGFVALRIAHGIAYITDAAGVRSVAWFGGLACVITLFARAALAVA